MFGRHTGHTHGKRWWPCLAPQAGSRQQLLRTVSLTAILNATVLALKEKLEALGGGGGPSGGDGWGGPVWRWRDDSSGDNGEAGKGQGGVAEQEEDEEEEEEEGVGSWAKMQPAFAHIGGVHGRGYEPKGKDGDEDEGEEGEEDIDGDFDVEEKSTGKEKEIEGESEAAVPRQSKLRPKRVYSDLPPNFVEVSARKDAEAEEAIGEDGADDVDIVSEGTEGSDFPAGFVENVDVRVVPPASASPAPEKRTLKLVSDAPKDEPLVEEEPLERRGSSPAHAVENWVSGVFGALLGRRTGAQPAPDLELLDAQSTAQRVIELLTTQQGDDSLAMRGDINALRRLQRETFAQLLEMRDRLSKLEFHTGLRHTRGKAALPAFASHLSGKTKVSGEVSIGVGLLALDEDQSRPTKRSLDHAALRTGTDVRINLETPFRTTDLLMTQLAAGDSHGAGAAGGSVLAVKKVMYRTQLTDWLCLRVAATGAQGADMAEALNPLEGQGLTALTSAGSALHRRCMGAAVAATARTNDWSWLTVGHFVSGWGPGSSAEEPLCHATLGQVTLRPAPECALAVVALNRHWPAPSLPSGTGLHWSELGPLLVPRIRASSPAPATNGESMRDSYESSSSSMNGTGDTWAGVGLPRLHGHSLRSYGFAGAVAAGELATFSGWAHMDQTSSGRGPQRGVQWGVTLSGVPDSPGVGWGLSVGSTQPEPWVRPADLRVGKAEPKGSQTQMEAFLNLTTGKGFTLTPGAVMIKEGQRVTGPAFMLRSTWAF
ncbi:hypothetical protein KFL_003870060 [Klebsormidium nitens]|uniref:Uncharacterized protein n=1 Tax=Klebsormidium nitens TaxID=105231 RepID=A0A1Y1IEQ1_KLENI|nr:hypothetical protein KFL_003870060 [Klebsormidium nitens]|eukprot:GAQ87909.1 hypothetical protein KFL_003870060 [Klebsormidium nitens]